MLSAGRTIVLYSIALDAVHHALILYIMPSVLHCTVLLYCTCPLYYCTLHPQEGASAPLVAYRCCLVTPLTSPLTPLQYPSQRDLLESTRQSQLEKEKE